MKSRIHPEWRGDGTAKLRELERVKRVREQQLRAAEKNLKAVDETATMQTTTDGQGPKRTRRVMHRGKLLDPRIRAILCDESDKGVGFEALVLRLEQVIRGLGSDPEGHACRHQLELALTEPSHEFMAYWLGYFGQLAGGIRGNVQLREPPRELDPIVVDAPARAIDPKSIEFNGRSVRVVLDATGEPLFVARDLVEAVGASWNGSQNLAHIPEKYRVVISVMTSFGAKETVCLTEAGMNFYLIRSDKPSALPLQEKLASEVLPSIRKTGTYTAPGAAPQLPPAPDANVGLIAAMLERNERAQERRDERFMSLLERFAPKRRASKSPNPLQQTIPQAEAPAKSELRLVEDPPAPIDEHKYSVARAKLMDNPRLWNIPKPGTVKDIKLMEELERMIEIYGMVSGLQAEKFSTAYDAIERMGSEAARQERRDQDCLHSQSISPIQARSVPIGLRGTGGSVPQGFGVTPLLTWTEVAALLRLEACPEAAPSAKTPSRRRGCRDSSLPRRSATMKTAKTPSRRRGCRDRSTALVRVQRALEKSLSTVESWERGSTRVPTLVMQAT